MVNGGAETFLFKYFLLKNIYHGNRFPINSIDEFMSRATHTGLLSILQATAAAVATMFGLLIKRKCLPRIKNI